MRLTLGHRALVVSLVVAATGAGGAVRAEAQSAPAVVARVGGGVLHIHYNLPEGRDPGAVTTAANITIEAVGSDYVVSSTSGELLAGGLCKGSTGNRRVECPIRNVVHDQIYVVTGGGNDVVTMRGLPASTFVNVGGLEGDDQLLGEATRGANRAPFFPAPRYRLVGGDGNDRLKGGPNNDVLAGDAGRDYVLGYAGNDTLNVYESPHLRDGFVYCGAGVDRLIRDPFDVFGSYSGCENVELP